MEEILHYLYLVKAKKIKDKNQKPNMSAEKSNRQAKQANGK
jgi:hypothetical protein